MERRKFIGASAVGAAGLFLASTSKANATETETTGTTYTVKKVKHAKALTNLKEDDTVIIKKRNHGKFDVVLASSIPSGANNINVIEITSDPTLLLSLRIDKHICLKQFGAEGDGIIDDTESLEQAILEAKGRQITVPAGTYKITRTIKTTSEYLNGEFTNGINIKGMGALSTIFESHVTSGAIIEVGDQDGQLNGASYAHGSELSSFAITQATGSTPDCGILMRNVSAARLDNLFIQGISGDGIRLENDANSTSGWSGVLITNCHIESCIGWGVSAVGAPNYVNGSRLTLDHVSINICGQAGTMPPTSGGLTWKGFHLTIDNSAFYKNQNANIFINANNGLPSFVGIENSGFTDGTIKSIYCTGITCMKASNLSLSNGQSTTLESFVEFNANYDIVEKVEFDNIKVSADTGAYSGLTAFNIYGTHKKLDTCSIKNVTYSQEYINGGFFKAVGFKDQSNFVGSKATAQLIYPTPSAVVWDTIENDDQDIAYAGSQIALSYQALYNFKGKVTISNLTTNTNVTIALKSTFPGLPQQQCVYIAKGQPSETFDFDFVGLLGDGHNERRYEILVHHNDISSRSLDITDSGYNRLSVTRIS